MRMITNRRFFLFSSFALVTFNLLGCSGTLTSASGGSLGVGGESVSEIVASVLVGSINTSDQNGASVAMNSRLFGPHLISGVLSDVLHDFFIPPALALSTCPVAPFGSKTTGTPLTTPSPVILLVYSPAGVGVIGTCNPPGASTIYWSGQAAYTFASSADLAAYQSAGGLTNGDQISLQYLGGIGPYSPGIMAFTGPFANPASSPPTYRVAGTVVYLDSTSADLTCWNNPTCLTSAAGGIITVMNPSSRSLQISGLRVAGATNTATVTPVWDYVMTTTANFTIQGQGTSKTVPSGGTGSITSYVNVQATYPTMNQQTVTSTVTKTLTWTTASCHPTSGQISTSCPGSTTAFETLTYSSPTSATLVTCQGASSSVTLQHCL